MKAQDITAGVTVALLTAMAAGSNDRLIRATITNNSNLTTILTSSLLLTSVAAIVTPTTSPINLTPIINPIRATTTSIRITINNLSALV